MTWRHVALVAMACALMIACVSSGLCASNPTALERASFVALAIVSFAGGNASTNNTNHPKPPKE